MKIQKLAFGMDFVPALNALARQEELWKNNEITLRGRTPQGQIVNWFSFDMLPDLRQYIFALMTRVNGEMLGPVAVRKLEQGSVTQFPLEGFQHYVLVMHLASGGLFFSAQGEALPGSPGDAIWLSPGGELTNNSQGEAIVLHVQLVPNAPATFVPA